MNTILLQKILDILTEGLAHVGDFFKDLFISEPQDGQVIGYDADAGKWKNMSVAELSLDVTNTAGPADLISFSDAADMPLKSLVVNINVEGGTNEVNVTHAGKNIWDENYTDIGSTVKYKQIKTGPGTFTFSTDEPKNTDNASNLFAIGSYATSGGSTNVNGVWNGQPRTVTTTDGYITIAYRKTLNNSPEDYHTQIELGEDSTAYEAFNGDTETITLPSSVSEGYIDVITGAGMSGDTPFTVTPGNISTKSGINNIYADTGNVTAVYYTKAAGDIKSLVCITDDITSQVTKNTTDFSDILLKVSRNNKVVSVEIYSATTAAAVNDTFLSNLPKPAMNCKVLLVNTTLGEDGTIPGTLKTSGELEIATSGAKSFSGLITYVAK